MNFSSELIKILEWIAEKFGIVIDWASTDLLPKIGEILMRFAVYKTYANLVGAGTMLVAMIVSAVLAGITKKKNYEYAPMIFTVISVGLFVGAVLLGINALEWHIVPEIGLVRFFNDQLSMIDN